MCRLIKRLWRATLPTDHEKSQKFQTVGARDGVVLLSKLMVDDNLHAQLHSNGMAIVKAVLVPHWYIASLSVIKLLLHEAGIQPSREGKSYRAKKRMLRIWSRAYLVDLMRRMHTQAGRGAPPGWLVRVHRTAADGALDESRAVDGYDAVFADMVEESNEDGELRVLNHFALDLLVPFSLEERARAHGFVALQLLLRKAWLLLLQHAGERGAFHVMHSLCRQLFGYFCRSPHRNMLALINASPSLSGQFGKSTKMDALQELFVLVVKMYMVDPNSKQLQSVLNTLASNLDIPMLSIPFIEPIWSRKAKRAESWRRSSHGGERAAVRDLAWLMMRTYLQPDRHRVARSGELGELGRMMLSKTVTLRPVPTDVLQLKIFHFVRAGGGPLCIGNVGQLRDVLQHRIEGGGDVMQQLQQYAQLIGLVFSPGRAADGELRADAQSGEILGYARVPWGVPAEPYFSSAALRAALTEDSLAGLQLLPVQGEAPDGGELARCSWVGRSARDASLGHIRAALPDEALVVRIRDRAPGTTRPTPSRRSWRRRCATGLGQC